MPAAVEDVAALRAAVQVGGGPTVGLVAVQDAREFLARVRRDVEELRDRLDEVPAGVPVGQRVEERLRLPLKLRACAYL